MFRPTILITALLAAGPALAFTAENGMRVNPLPQPGTFEVISRPGFGPAQYWCAASDYAFRALGKGTTGRVSVLDGPHDPLTQAGRTAVSFTVNTDGTGRRPGQDGKYFLSIKEPGYNLSVSMGRSFCEPDIPIFP